MIYTQQELAHLIFLAGVVRDGNKKGLMEETIQCLLYIVKSLPEVDLPEGVIERIEALTEKVEEELRGENDRLHEIQYNLSHLSERKFSDT
jgi:predicted DNA-binding antitoxin AbrB/MazE fold protein